MYNEVVFNDNTCIMKYRTKVLPHLTTKIAYCNLSTSNTNLS